MFQTALYSAEKQKFRFKTSSRNSSPRSAPGGLLTLRTLKSVQTAAPQGSHLHAELVALEELPAGVPVVLALEKLLGEPAVEALVVLALQLGARLPYAVHGGSTAPLPPFRCTSGACR